jgi:hypothetical protein
MNMQHGNSVTRSIVLGFLLGLSFVAFTSFFSSGLGASKAIALAAFHIQDWITPISEDLQYMHYYITAGGKDPADSTFYSSTYAMIGLMLGALFTSRLRNETKLAVTRGPQVGVAVRLLFCVLGGVMLGFASRLARGCTSGVGLVGGMQMAVGAYIFLFAAFAGGFAAAYFVRRQWL